MTNLNTIKCSNCGEINILYEKNCSKCKHYLRSSVVNIDLWSTIWMLFENPKKSIKNIIMAENKNFIVFLLFFLSIKIFLTSVTMQSAFNFTVPDTNYFLLNILLVTAIYLIIILLFSFVLTRILSSRIKTRFKDNLSIVVYSFIPIIFSLFILTPVEYGIFGKHWILYNPSPFLIKNSFAYLLVGLELVMLFWSLIILYSGIKVQSNSNIIPIITTLLFIIMISVSVINIPFSLL